MIGIMDGDGQHSPDDMQRLILEAEKAPDSLILGVRDVGRTMPFRSRFGNRVTREIFHMLSGSYISDTQSGRAGKSGGNDAQLLSVRKRR